MDASSLVKSIIEKGGKGSGNFGHAGRPGKVGGSASENTQGDPVQPPLFTIPKEDRGRYMLPTDPIDRRNYYSVKIHSITGRKPGIDAVQAVSESGVPVEFLSRLMEGECLAQDDGGDPIPSNPDGLRFFTKGDNCDNAVLTLISDLWNARDTRYVMADFVDLGLNASDINSLYGYISQYGYDGPNYLDPEILTQMADTLSLPENETAAWVANGLTETPELIDKTKAYLAAGLTDPRLATALDNTDMSLDQFKNYVVNRGYTPEEAVLSNYEYDTEDIRTMNTLYDLTPTDLIDLGEMGYSKTDTEKLTDEYAISPEDIIPLQDFSDSAIYGSSVVGFAQDTLDYEDDSGIYTKTDYIEPDKYDDGEVAGVLFKGKVYMPDGRVAGKFARYLTASGEMIHQRLELNGMAQGQGFGYDYYRHLEEQYTEHGISAVRIHAGLTVGGYAWARMGYDFASDGTREKFRRKFATKVFHVVEADKGEGEGEVAYNDAFDSVYHSWDIAAYTLPNGERIGKSFMLGSDWQAIKVLDDSSEGWDVGNAYYDAKDEQYGKGK